jgi:hypothetical protein
MDFSPCLDEHPKTSKSHSVIKTNREKRMATSFSFSQPSRCYSKPERVRMLDDGSYLMGDWNGRIFKVLASGEKLELLNTMDAKLTLADFEFIPGKSLLVVPTLNGNRVLAFRVKQP